MDEATYREMLEGYPEVGQFAYLQKVGHKYSLSEKYNHREYDQLIRSAPIWREFHGWIKSDEFVVGVIDALKAHHIDLGYGKPPSTAKRTGPTLSLKRSRTSTGFSASIEFASGVVSRRTACAPTGAHQRSVDSDEIAANGDQRDGAIPAGTIVPRDMNRGPTQKSYWPRSGSVRTTNGADPGALRRNCPMVMLSSWALAV